MRLRIYCSKHVLDLVKDTGDFDDLQGVVEGGEQVGPWTLSLDNFVCLANSEHDDESCGDEWKIEVMSDGD